MKIAYLCLCHSDPYFVAQMAKTLTADGDDFFIHVDQEMHGRAFVWTCHGIPNVHFVDHRICVTKGGFSAIAATMETIKLALETDDYDRFVLLQGQDYPLFSNKQIHKFFEDNADKEFLHAANVSQSRKKKDYMNCCGYWAMDWGHGIGTIISTLLSAINCIGIKYRPGSFNFRGSKWDVWRGNALFALTRECVEYIYCQYTTNKRYNRFMKHRFPPDEIYIPTLIYNSRFRNAVSDHIITDRENNPTQLNLTYCECPKFTTVFTEAADYAWLKNTGALYVRRVNFSSKALLDEIEKQCEQTA